VTSNAWAEAGKLEVETCHAVACNCGASGLQSRRNLAALCNEKPKKPTVEAAPFVFVLRSCEMVL
jgi:hypothetical protein